MAPIRSVNELAALLQADFALTPVMGTEIEFYLHGASLMGSGEQVVEHIGIATASAGIAIAHVEAEKGKDQFEISLIATRDLQQLSEQTKRLKTLMQECFGPKGVQADFAAKPVDDQPGSGLHIHMHLDDVAGKNSFTRAGDEMNDPFSDILLHSLGGMLALMNPCMTLFVPTKKSYARFVAKSNAPLTVSWGTNNRTVALRLPTKGLDNKHIEHRVAGSDADVASVMAAVLAGAHYGLAHETAPGEPVYGDAALPQYRLPPLAKNPEEAAKYFTDNKALLFPYLA